MKQLAIAPILALIVVLVACGNSNNSGNINGNWTASLTNTAFNFTTSLSVNGDQSLRVTNFNFSTSSPCFESGDSETGSFTLSGNVNGNVTGKFQFTVQSGFAQWEHANPYWYGEREYDLGHVDYDRWGWLPGLRQFHDDEDVGGITSRDMLINVSYRTPEKPFAGDLVCARPRAG